MSQRLKQRYILGLLTLATALIAGLELVQARQAFVFHSLPLPDPVPTFMAVYPQPGQFVPLSERPGDIILQNPGSKQTTFNIPIMWQPGDVCVVVDAAEIIQPGQFWKATDIASLSKMAIDKVDLAADGGIVDGLLSQATVINGNVLAETGGPYGMCWHGPLETGYHQATFSFEATRYDWWYQIGR